MNTESLHTLSNHLSSTGGVYAADWLGLVRVIEKVLQDQPTTADGSAQLSSSLDKQQLLWNIVSSALLRHDVGTDPAAARLWEIFFELLLVFRDNNNKDKMDKSASALSCKSCYDNAAKYFSFVLSLPLGERNLKRIFHLLGEFPPSVKADVFSCDGDEQDQDGSSSFFTRLGAAVQLSRDEGKTWPLRLVAAKPPPQYQSGDELVVDEEDDDNEEHQLLFPSAAATSGTSNKMLGRAGASFTSSNVATHLKREQLRYCEWARVLARRLENPLKMKNAEHFRSFVGIVVRQMLFEIPHCELAHVAAFLVDVLLDEQQQQQERSGHSTAGDEGKLEKLRKYRQRLFLALCTCGRARDLSSSCLSSSSSSSSSTSSFTLTEELISSFPTLCAVYELISSESGDVGDVAEKASSKKSKKDSSSSSSVAPSPLFQRLKNTTQSLCKPGAGGSGSGSNNNTLAFSWLQNLWKSVIVDKLLVPTTSQQEQQQDCQQAQQQQQQADDDGGDSFARVSSAIKDLKKYFRMPGKTASAAHTGDAAFFADWALGEQLLLKDTVLLPEIFRQASSIAPSTDPAGAPVVVRAAIDLFGSQRAEGPAGTVLERAVERTTSQAGAASRSQLLLRQELDAFSSNNASASAATQKSNNEPVELAPLGTDTALWSAFSDFTSSQNSTVEACEAIERRRRAAVYGSGVMAITANEDSARRIASSPSEHYLWHMRQLSLGGGLVLPASDSEVAWASLMRDLEVARRSSVAEAGAAAALSAPPTKNPAQTIAGFPSMHEFGANPMRLPLQKLEDGAPPPETTTLNALDERLFDAEAEREQLRNVEKRRRRRRRNNQDDADDADADAEDDDDDEATTKLKTRHHPYIVPEFIRQQTNNQNSNIPTSNAAPSSSSSKQILWGKLSTLPRNPHPPQPNIETSQVDEIAGPHTLRPIQRFQIDATTAARLQREKELERRRSRKILVQSLAEASGVASDEALELLDDLPNFLLSMTRASIVAQNAIQQEELEAELNGDKSYKARPLPASSWLMKKLSAPPK